MISPQNPNRLVDLVDASTGSGATGSCPMGPYRPFGLVRLGPDAPYPQRANQGYRPGEPIARLSHTHASGTGGPARYGNIAITPFTGPPATRKIPPWIRVPLERMLDAYPEDEEAKVGYYAVTMRPWNVRCELTTTRHAGIHRYTFPGDKEPHVLLDTAACIILGGAPLGSELDQESGAGLQSRPVWPSASLPGHGDVPQDWDSTAGSIGGRLKIISDREIIGRSDFRGGWGHDDPYSIHFYYMSDVPFTKALLASDDAQPNEGREVTGSGIRCVLSYPGTEVLHVRVGISFVSVEKARAYVERETADKTFEDIREESEAEWEGWLSSFCIQGGRQEQRHTFYSLLYRLLCMPTDLGVDEENPHWQSGVRNFTDYCLWDSIRNANSFFHLFFPDLSRDLMNALLDVAEHTGWLPDAHIANRHAFIQGACGCEVIFSEAALKGIDDVDYAKALEYMRDNNEKNSPDPLVKGRYRDDYNMLGYVSTEEVRKGSVSRHLEYTYHDWCIAQLAAHLGDWKTAERYRENSRRVWNLWRDGTKTFYPKHRDGRWLEGYDPWEKPAEGCNDPSCYEGSTWVWSFNVFQDFHELIKRMGGTEEFILRLNHMFNGGYFQIKETRMHLPHLYTYAGRPDMAAERVLANLARYKPGPDGLPDNEDMGCQSGYFLWQAMGLYPIYGQTLYMLTPPLFDRIVAKIDKCEDNTLEIAAKRIGTGKYIHKCELGNQVIDRAWITHEELMRARRIHFWLSDTPSDWGRDSPPPRATKPEIE